MRGEKFKNTFFFASSLPPRLPSLPLPSSPISSHFPSLPLPFFPTSLHFPFLPSILIPLPSHSDTDPHYHLLPLTVPSAASPPLFKTFLQVLCFPSFSFPPFYHVIFLFLPLSLLSFPYFFFFTNSLFILAFDSSFFFPLLPLLSILHFFP